MISLQIQVVVGANICKVGKLIKVNYERCQHNKMNMQVSATTRLIEVKPKVSNHHLPKVYDQKYFYQLEEEYVEAFLNAECHKNNLRVIFVPENH
mgnify:CR=1 FL=1